MNAPTQQLAEIKQRETVSQMSDTKVDMFSARGFALAQRIASAFATSDAVPAQFRSFQLKKANGQEQWVENPAAMGNCIVAIEVAQAVGMSVTAVMQNADVIEGKLRWSDRFVVAGINASHRFTPLRFDVKNLGPVTATYKEKTGWDNAARKPIFTDRTVTLDNLQSIAWALPAGFAVPPNVYTLDQARAANLPVIEGPPVSMRLAVEEGWYGKAGSKWQTELKHKMLMMRSGRYFGDIHAPDIVMGIGRTSEEERDIIDVTPQGDGSFAVSVDTLKATTKPPAAPQTPEAGPDTPSASADSASAQGQPGDGGAAPLNPSGDGGMTAEEKAAAIAREQQEATGQTTATRTRRERGQAGSIE